MEGAGAVLKEEPQVSFAYAQIAYMLIAFAMAYIAGQLLAKKRKSPIDDDKPTTLTRRGSYTPWVMGIRRIGPVFAWAGDRQIKQESAGGGKGFGGGAEQDIWYESGWHQLGPGPCHALHQIIKQGQVIFQGPITVDSHPSGTVVDLGKEGSFAIYWGEEDQPVNVLLGDTARVGITSRWPFMCYVHWIEHRLGTAPQWSIVDYVMEKRPTTVTLTQTSGYIAPTLVLDGPIVPVDSVNANANPDIGWIAVLDDYSQEFPADSYLEATGAGIPDGIYLIRRTTVVQDVAPPYTIRTRFFLDTGTAGATATGTVQSYTSFADDGVNHAHIIAEILFAPWPTGLGLDPDGEEPWDLESLEEVGVTVQNQDEDLRGSVIATDGDTAAAVLGQVLVDIGCMVCFDTFNDGKLKFKLIREPTGTLPHLSEQLLAQEVSEQRDVKDALPTDRIIFAFTNRERQFVTDTFDIDEDGQATFAEYASADEVEVPTTVVLRSASRIGERRSQELLAGASAVPIIANRAARSLLPGDAITAEGFEDVLRVLEVKVQVLSGKVTLTAMPDSYGAPVSTFEQEEGGGGGPPPPVEADPIVAFLEAPEHLNTTGEMAILVPHVRAHVGIVNGSVHISRDGVTYTLKGVFNDIYSGGVTSEILSTTDFVLDEQGPAFTTLGPDINLVQDLTADETNWKIGRQACVIVSTAGTEICFLRNIEALGGDSYRLRGLLRARFDTRRVTHPVGAEVYIFRAAERDAIYDLLLAPGEDLFVKNQPGSTAGQLPLSSIVPEVGTLYGKGIVPMDPEGLRCTAPYHMAPAYRSGQGVTVEWSYLSTLTRGTGAGMQGFGNATGSSAVDGSFEIEVTTTADVVLQTTSQVEVTFSLTNGQIIGLLGSEVSFKIKVRSVRGGFRSRQISLTIAKVA